MFIILLIKRYTIFKTISVIKNVSLIKVRTTILNEYATLILNNHFKNKNKKFSFENLSHPN